MKFTLFFIILISCMISCNALPFPNDDNDNNYPIVNTIGTITEMPDIPLPKNITIPKGRKFKFLLSAYGVQIYKCFVNDHDTPNNWTLVTPNAYAINDKSKETFTPEFEVVHHYFLKKPINEGRIVWESLVKDDDSLIVGKAIAINVSPDGPKNLPWVVIEITHHEGNGRLSDITNVLRVCTKDGVAPPVGQCGTHYRSGETAEVTYQADYWFFH